MDSSLEDDDHLPSLDLPPTLSSGSQIIVIIILTIMIVMTIIGNILVCLSVVLVKKLRHPANYLLVSLAISDLCVALLVMPLALYGEMSPSWGLGRIVCNMWVSFDVTCCTASILNLCTISIDRYLTITRPLTYGVNATARRSFLFIGVIWIASCLISVPPLLVFGNEHGSSQHPECQVSQNIIYQLYATLGAFYIPLLVMIVMYYKIYVAAKRVVEAELRAQPAAVHSGSAKLLPLNDRHEILLMHTTHSRTHPSSLKAVSESVDQRHQRHHHLHHNSNYLYEAPNGRSVSDDQSLSFMSSSFVEVDDRNDGKSQVHQTHPHHHTSGRPSSRGSSSDGRATLKSSVSVRSASDLRERKASVTLGVIMTAFTVCWLPFFILAVLRPFSQSVDSIPPWIVSFALWLGYANSMLNPVIYVTFHQDFRQAFRYLLCLQCSSLGTRLREEAFQSTFGQPTSSFAGNQANTSSSRSPSIVKMSTRKKNRLSFDQVS